MDVRENDNPKIGKNIGKVCVFTADETRKKNPDTLWSGLNVRTCMKPSNMGSTTACVNECAMVHMCVCVCVHVCVCVCVYVCVCRCVMWHNNITKTATSRLGGTISSSTIPERK